MGAEAGGGESKASKLLSIPLSGGRASCGLDAASGALLQTQAPGPARPRPPAGERSPTAPHKPKGGKQWLAGATSIGPSI
jgi:hypothetical protein